MKLLTYISMQWREKVACCKNRTRKTIMTWYIGLHMFDCMYYIAIVWSIALGIKA